MESLPLGLGPGTERPVDAAAARTGFPAVLKTARLGYDGKGQVRVDAKSDLMAAWTSIGKMPSVLEGFVDFEREISVIVARSVESKTESYVARG